MFQITKNYITFNRSYQKLVSQGAVTHSTDTPGATDENEQAFFNSRNVSASANTFIDWDSITETIPRNEVSWGSGPTSNHRYLQVELCEPSGYDPAKFQAVWDRAVWYFANYLKNDLGITTVTTDNVLSHAEVSNRWHETDHQDPIEYFTRYGKTMDQFRQAVQEQINKGDVDMKKLVVYFGDADVFAAIMVAQKNRCPLMSKADFEASGLKSEEVIQIGGNDSSTRFDTFKHAASLL